MVNTESSSPATSIHFADSAGMNNPLLTKLRTRKNQTRYIVWATKSPLLTILNRVLYIQHLQGILYVANRNIENWPFNGILSLVSKDTTMVAKVGTPIEKTPSPNLGVFFCPGVGIWIESVKTRLYLYTPYLLKTPKPGAWDIGVHRQMFVRWKMRLRFISGVLVIVHVYGGVHTSTNCEAIDRSASNWNHWRPISRTVRWV